jgi:hypothetical protein
MKFQGRAISFKTYIMFMEKYGLIHEGKTMKEMALEIYTYEIEHGQDINVGLYINGLF